MSHCIVTIPNNEEGKQFVSTLRGYLKNTPNTVLLRGRGPRLRHMAAANMTARSIRQDLPLRFAERLAVYITKRPTHRLKRVMKPSWELVPTKWANVK